MREIRLLQRLHHPNILQLKEIIGDKGKFLRDFYLVYKLINFFFCLAISVHMVFDYLDHDLTGLLSHPTFTYQQAHIKCLMHQMLSGLQYLHGQGILHRDIKGSNILLNNRGELKLADFGLARTFSSGDRQLQFTNRVITLWYRPPELLLGATKYGPEVDIWGVA